MVDCKSIGWYSAWLALLAVVFYCSACAGHQTGINAVMQDPVPTVQAGLPQPAEIARELSAVVNTQFAFGADYLHQSSGWYQRTSLVAGTDYLRFDSDYDPANDTNAKGLAYAVFKFGLPGFTGEPRVRLRWDAGAPLLSECWIGIADHASGAWSWRSPWLGGVATWDDFNGCFNPVDELMVIVVVGGTNTSDLAWVSVGGKVPVTRVTEVTVFNPAFPSVLMVDGHPAICYIDTYPPVKLKYVRANDKYGLSWGTPQVISGAGSSSTSLAIVNGRPAIAFYNGTLHYVRAMDSVGSSWEPPVVVDSGSQNGQYCSMLVVGGQPAISYHGVIDGTLKYVRSTNEVGSNWAIPQTLDATGLAGQYTSMVLVNNRPAIAYQGDTALKYLRSNDELGGSWGSATTLSDGLIDRSACSMQIVNGYPAISFMGDSGSDVVLSYIRSTDSDGVNWGPVQVLADANFTDEQTSLAVIGGKPAVAYRYWDWSYCDWLRFIRADDKDGSSWLPVMTLDNSGSVGSYPAMIEANSMPLIAYCENTNAGQRAMKSCLLVDLEDFNLWPW